MRLKDHEKFIKKCLAENEADRDWTRLYEYHRVQISELQHERLIHLLVTLSFAIFFLSSFLYFITTQRMDILPLVLLFLAMLIPYIFHYFMLENTVQRWYILGQELFKKIAINE